VFQFNPGADGCVVQGFEICNASNDTFNGAAIRINQASHVQVLDCEIHGCDMGIMSNGDASADPPGGLDQWIEGCIIHGNGSFGDPGYNHNLYLGGTSVTLRGCEVYGSLTGHNVKSRAHFNRFEFCYVHDSANREFDLVDDATNTSLPGSDSILLGCVIAKDPACAGNRNVIHFGQDGGGDHNGQLYLAHCTIATPFVSPVVLLSTAGAAASFAGNLLWDQSSGQANQVVIDTAGGASLAQVAGSRNWLSAGFQVPLPQFDVALTWSGAAGVDPPFANAAGGDYHLTATMGNLTDSGSVWPAGNLPATPGHAAPADNLPAQYSGGPELEARCLLYAPDLGAYEYLPAPAN
jgi:hypothetical protein